MDFTELVDLAQERLGATVVCANDDFFAPKDNLLKADKPIWIEGKYTDRGKWMDGWETRRRRTPGHDFAIVRLGAPGIVRGVIVDTAFFKGNYPEHCSIDACSSLGNPGADELASPATKWFPLLAKTPLAGDAQNKFAIDVGARVTHVRLNIFPDGGVARLRILGEVAPAPRWLGRPGSASEVDLAAVENGGVVALCNDMFFGSRHNLIMPGRSANMGDGWETRRSGRVGTPRAWDEQGRESKKPDWVIVKLAAIGTIHRVEIDTNHFKGNAPESASLAVAHAPHAGEADLAKDDRAWHEIIGRTKIQPHTRHFYEREIVEHAPATHAKLSIFPDGGISRLRLFGLVSREGREQIGVRHLNALMPDDAMTELLACCGSRAWAKSMTARRPFSDLHALIEAANAAWRETKPEDWLEAFRAHPRIGERRSAPSHAPSPTHGSGANVMHAQWSEQEQSKAQSSDATTLEALTEANREYEARFGHIYIVCATGKAAGEMLGILRDRMKNDAKKELEVAAEEQRKITALRLEKLVQR
jgi:allantoicase